MKTVFVRLIYLSLFVLVFLLAYLSIGILIGKPVPTPISSTIARLTSTSTSTPAPSPGASPTVPPTPSTSLAGLQVGVTTRLISPSRNEVRVKLIGKEIYSEVENTLRLEIFQNGIWQPKTITQTINIAPSVTVVTKGFIVIPSDWSSLYEKEIGFEETVEFFRVDNPNRTSFKFVKRSPEGYVDLVIQLNDQSQVSANLCSNGCGTSLGMGSPDLNGIDAQNSGGIVTIIFHDPWRVLNP